MQSVDPAPTQSSGTAGGRRAAETPAETARRGPAERRPAPEALAKVRNIIAVGSGKGGVGKSTVTANLAVALQKLGAKVAVMDADVYGPSQPGLMGAIGQKADAPDQKLQPLVRHGVGFMSLGLVMPTDGPVIWRAPMAMKVLYEFLGNVNWGELDYLLVDLPPGTGDIQLTLAQQAPLTGSIVVTTPQDVALGVARKGLQMFQQVKVPILGVIENMSGFICDGCGKTHNIFKKGGGVRLAEEMKVPFLGAIPMDTDVMEGGDAGVPVLVRNAAAPGAKAFLAAAEAFEVSLAQAHGGPVGEEPKAVNLGPAGELLIEWPDGHKSVLPAWTLRTHCGCAICVDEDTGKRLLDPKKIPLDVKVDAARPVGRYGLALTFSDSHNTGIYIFKDVKELCECPACLARRGKPAETFAV